MLDAMTCEIIPFPVVEKTMEVLRRVVWQLEDGDLMMVAASLLALAAEASRHGAEADFYDRTKTAYLVLERVLLEGERI
ncbi:hypothetical protein [Lichenicoccus roseus]|uniref:Uncharacterized protein n=1 Tax=Lichenicoccus roseus TaxID=2683649 RepID=A0A5R9IZQ3_9PROT|nr:hypothetical protein [Lichenicoccus roseus]TLU70944.1 hypothetical protein FE263_18975 [Lichenicoccus roseus]